MILSYYIGGVIASLGMCLVAEKVAPDKIGKIGMGYSLLLSFFWFIFIPLTLIKNQ